MTRIVVTGASGFLGRHLVSALSEQGYDVLGVARAAGPGVERQVESYYKLESREILGGCHAECDLIHLAGEPRVHRFSEDKKIGWETERLCDRLARLPWRHCIFASSGAIYDSKPAGVLIPETGILSNTSYAKTKRICEQNFIASGGTALRLTNLVGAGMHNDTIIGEIVKLRQDSGGLPKTVLLRNCSAVIDFLAVEDAVTAFQKSLLVQNRNLDLVNIGSGKPIEARKLAEMVYECMGETFIEANSTRPEKNVGIVLDTKIANRLMKWQPEKSLSDAISAAINSK